MNAADRARRERPPASRNAVHLLSEHWREWNEAAEAHKAEGWEEMVSELSALQEAVAGSAPPAEAVAEASALLHRARLLLEPHVGGDDTQVFGRLLDLATRGQTLSPPLWIHDYAGDVMTGATRFGRFHTGNNGAVHGGAIALMFDDALGRTSDMGGRGRSRTAHLAVDFRSLTPFDRELDVRVRFARQEGRKRYLEGVISDGDRVCAEATGLFVEMRPEQP